MFELLEFPLMSFKYKPFGSFEFPVEFCAKLEVLVVLLVILLPVDNQLKIVRAISCRVIGSKFVSNLFINVVINMIN